MKKLLFLILVLAAGYYFFVHEDGGDIESVLPDWLSSSKDPRVVSTYKRFARAVAYRRYDEARQFAVGEVLAKLSSGQPTSAGIVDPAWEGRHTVVQEKDDRSAKLLTAKHSVESVTMRPDKTYLVRAKETLCRQQPDCSGRRCKVCTSKIHLAEICPHGPGWRVCGLRVVSAPP